MKRVLRFLGWVAAIIGILVLALALSIPIDGLFGAGRISAISNVQINNPNGPAIQAYVARPSTPGPHPAVIMVHEWWGLNPAITGMADALAQEGYVVIAPDVFRGSTTNWIPRAIYQVSTASAEQINTDLDAVYNWVREQPDVVPDRVGIIGFCFGGRTSLRYSLHNPGGITATAVFYGMATTDPAELATLQSPVLGVFGGADNSIPVSEVQALERGLQQAGVPNTITIYPGQPHAFVSDAEAIRRAGAAQDAWNQLVGFLATHLKDSVADNGMPATAIPAWWAETGTTTVYGEFHHMLVCAIQRV